jgi:competence protein ComEA
MFAETETQTRRRRLLLAAGLAGSVVLLVAAGIVGWMSLRPSTRVDAAPIPIGEPLDAPATADILVFVSGAVAHPGLYRLAPGARVADAIAVAGGMTPDADPGRLPDLAARIHDGKQVNVPFVRTAGSSGVIAAKRLDLNTATVEQLRAVPGMPVGLPEAIVEARDMWGPFGSLTQLRTLLGLDTATLSALRPYLRVVARAP